MSSFTVAQQFENMRLDVYITNQYPEYGRSLLSKLFESKDVLVNDKALKPSYKLREGDKVTVNIDRLNAGPPEIKLPIIYEDENVIVINKPAGVLTHSKGNLNNESTVASFIKNRINLEDWAKSDPGFIDPYTNSNNAFLLANNRAGIVHRLDRDTSGVIICAKNTRSQKWLQAQFSTRKVKKEYVAIVVGELDPAEAIIDAAIERNPKKPQIFRVGEAGKSAQTHYRVLKSNTKYSLIKLLPTTGRTHQLRVHMQYLHRPILGDRVYGVPSDRLYLHANKLELVLPDKSRRIFTAPIPKTFVIKDK